MGLPKVNSSFVKKVLQDKGFLSRLRQPVKIDSSKDVPYLAGYSKDGKTIYFDRHFRPIFNYHGRAIDTRRFITIHEVGEKALIDLFHFRYAVAHHIITHYENEAVKAARISTRAYAKFLSPQIKHIYHDKLKDLPKDLDPTPYIDEHEKKIIKALQNGKDIRKKLIKKTSLMRRLRK